MTTLRTFNSLRSDLLARREVALLDVREEDPHAHAHPLFAANLSTGRIELDAYTRLPRKNVAITVFDDGEGLAAIALRRLIDLGYSDVAILDGGLTGWRLAGGEVFRDVNVPSKAFGELVEAERHTPSLSAQDVKALLDTHSDIVILDARRFDEFNTMSVPTAISVPGGELVYRVRDIATRPDTTVVVNCGGRTRSILGAQSLINAGVANKVVTLRNGTIGWVLAGQRLARGETRQFGAVSVPNRELAAASARIVADRAGVRRVAPSTLHTWSVAEARTIYCFDVRTAAEYIAGHIEGFIPAPGGQLVQEMDFFAPVRGARIVLADDDGVRANMAASWLAQMAWEVYVLDEVSSSDFSVQGDWDAPMPEVPTVSLAAPTELARAILRGEVAVIDLGPSREYVRQHIAGAWFALRGQFPSVLALTRGVGGYAIVSADDALARFACAELRGLTSSQVCVLQGGTDAWKQLGLPMESGATRMASPAIDRYRRPYEGVDHAAEAMQAYLDWEFGLVEQLRRDGTHGFAVV